MSRKPIRWVWLTLIVIGFWGIWGDQLSYLIQSKISPVHCHNFSSNVAILKELDDGKVVYSNGVLVEKDTILTVKHSLVNVNYVIFANGILYRDWIVNVDTDPNLDLAILTIKPIPGMSSAKISSDPIGPFTLVTLRDYEIKWIFAGDSFKSESYFVFENNASIEGDSGAPLLNRDCEVVAIVHGGTHSFLWNLRPSSEYTFLNK